MAITAEDWENELGFGVVLLQTVAIPNLIAHGLAKKFRVPLVRRTRWAGPRQKVPNTYFPLIA
jgi:hypothetical protein